MSAHFNKNVCVISDTKPVTNRWTTLERGLYLLIQHNFQNYNEFKVISNIKMYKPSADPFVFAQKTGKIPEICEVYMNGHYLCDVSIFDRPEQALTKIQDGIIEKITEGKFIRDRKGGKI